MSASVTVDAEAYLSDFEDDDIIDETIEIVERRAKQRAAGKTSRLDEETDDAIRRLRIVLAGPDDSVLPPRSTAAEIKTMADLRKWRESQSPKQQASDDHRKRGEG